MSNEKQLVVNLALKSGTMKQQINSINKEIRQLQTDFKSAGAGVEGFEKTSEGLSAKLKLQQSVIEKLKDKISVYKIEQEKCTKTLDKAVDAYQKQEQKVKSLEGQLQEAKETYGENSEEVKNLEEQLTKATKALDTKRNSVINANNALTTMNTTISSTEAEIKGMESEIGRLTSELDNMQNGINEVEGGIDELGDSLNEAGENSVAFGAHMSEIGQGLIQVGDKATEAGKKILGALGEGVSKALDYEDSMKRLQAQLGLTSDEMLEYEDIANNLYRQGLGEAIDEVANALKVVQNNTDLVGEELEEATKQALSFADIFGADVTESSRAASMMMKFFGVNAEQAYNIMVQGQRQGLDYSGELLDSITEYTPHFAQLGLSAEDMFNVMIDGAKTGAFNLDKVGDAVKELGIRIKDGTGNDALKELGFSADEVVSKFNNGGKEAQEAFYGIFEALGKVDDQTKLNTLGTELMGTMFEDLGKDAAIALGDMSDGFNRNIDSAEEARQTNSSLKDSFESISRTIDTTLITSLKESFEPILAELVPKIEEVVEKITNWVEKNPELTQAIVLIVGGLGGLLAVLGPIISTVGMLTIAIGAFNVAMLPTIGTIALVVAGIVALIAIVVLLIAKWDDIVACWKSFCEWAKQLWSDFTNWITTKFTEIKDKTVAKVQEMKQNLIDKWNEIKTSVTNKITEMKNGVVNKFNEIKNNISTTINNIKSTLSAWGNNIKTTVYNAFSTVYETITSPFRRAWSFIAGIGDKISGVISKINPFKNLFRTIDTTIMPTVNTGGIAPLSLDNVALSGSYYNANSRASLNANDMIRQVNGSVSGVSLASQTLAFDSITKQFTNEIANLKAENKTMMNMLVNTLSSMTKAMQDYVLQDHIEIKNNLEIENTVHYNPKKMANSISPYMDKSVGKYNKLAMR